MVGEGGALRGPLAPLVVGDPVAAEALPEVIACEDPSVPPRDEGTFAAPTASATPADALAVFLATEPQLAQRGYTQLDLPDGSVGFVPGGPGPCASSGGRGVVVLRARYERT